MGRHGGRPSPNFSGLLAGKCVHVAPKIPSINIAGALPRRYRTGQSRACILVKFKLIDRFHRSEVGRYRGVFAQMIQAIQAYDRGVHSVQTQCITEEFGCG